jgi:hypothetical protein
MSEQSWLFSIGALIAVVSYMLKNFVFDPLLEYRKTKGKVQSRLRYRANMILTPSIKTELAQEISQELRDLSCELEEKYTAIAFVRQLWWLWFLPKRRNIAEASKGLIYLSNTVGSGRDDLDRRDKTVSLVRNMLKIMEPRE